MKTFLRMSLHALSSTQSHNKYCSHHLIVGAKLEPLKWVPYIPIDR